MISPGHTYTGIASQDDVLVNNERVTGTISSRQILTLKSIVDYAAHLCGLLEPSASSLDLTTWSSSLNEQYNYLRWPNVTMFNSTPNDDYETESIKALCKNIALTLLSWLNLATYDSLNRTNSAAAVVTAANNLLSNYGESLIHLPAPMILSPSSSSLLANDSIENNKGTEGDSYLNASKLKYLNINCIVA